MADSNQGIDAVYDAIRFVQDITCADGVNLPDIGLFLFRIAAAESRFGAHPSTYRDGYHGGIWQVDRIGFQDTQNLDSHPGLESKFMAIYEVTGKAWQDQGWEICRDPRFSCLAARLYLCNKPSSIPLSKHGQAAYWKAEYNSLSGAGTVEHFLSANIL